MKRAKIYIDDVFCGILTEAQIYIHARVGRSHNENG